MNQGELKKQVEYWRTGTADDFSCAEMLARSGHGRQALFFAHLALEKALRAHVTHATGSVAPKKHSLTILAQMSGLAMDEEMINALGAFNRFNITGRYPSARGRAMSCHKLDSRMEQARRILTWLMT